MRVILRVVLTFAILEVTGCTTVPSDAPGFSKAPAAPANMSNVYFYRTGAYPTARVPTIKLNGRPTIEPPEGSYTVLVLPRGKHDLEFEWAWDVLAPMTHVTITVGSESQYYKLGGYRTSSEVGTTFERMEPKAAILEMQKCCRRIKNSLETR
jgi:hypothetical protein